ncbi:restriction endonuclease subunit S [uncultured Treponema sp.]|uniref:restriction endonuclease subunit S n=1 Tax=uncultured Treponema sp. TaxID=162155 RepID=UPI00258C8C8A|nr:restriction endonuclease subunit S [uncultured Treponema sp.]
MAEYKMVRLGDVCEIQSGGTPSRSKTEYWKDGTIPWVKIGDFSGKYLDKTTEHITQQGLDNSSAKLFSKGTILYSIFATLGEATILNIDATTNQAIAGIKIKDKSSVDIDYFYSFLKSLKDEVNRIGRGVAQNNINLSILKSFFIPLPPLETQKQIAAQLDKCTAVIAKHKQMLEKYATLIKSRFIEMFGTENDFSKWNCCFVEDVADVTVGVVIKPTQYYCEKGIPAFRSLNIGEMKVNDSDWVYFTEEGNEKNRKSILKENDVLVVRSGAPGKSCVITKKYEGYNVVDAIIAHPNLEKVNPVFLCMFTNMPHGMNQIKAKTGGAAQQHFNVGGYNSLKIILPPLSLQNDFAAFVQQIDKSKFAVQKSLEKAETLYKSLMQEYFG